MTFEQIADQLGISKSRAWQLYLSGMAKLRRGRADHLRPFLSDRRGQRGTSAPCPAAEIRAEARIVVR